MAKKGSSRKKGRKKRGTYAGAKAGSGKNFRALEKSFASRKGKRKVRSPGGLTAYIGRKKYTKARFQKMAAAGRRRKKG